MQELYNYIFGSKRLERAHYDTTLEEFCDKNNIDIEYIDKYQLSAFYYFKREDSHVADAKNHYLNNIVESLTSYSGKRLAERLQKIVGVHGEVAFNETDTPHTIVMYLKDSYLIDKFSFLDFTLSDTKESDKIYNELKNFKYHITEIGKNNISAFIIIEPRYSEDVTKKLRSKTDIFYHITTKNNVERIFKRGLTPRVGKTRIQGGYRYFPEKLFLIADSENVKKDIQEVIESKQYKDYVIIKIDLTGHNIGLYIDDYYGSENIVYTYEAIPPNLLTIARDAYSI